MRVLITGITGMCGSHLADYILENHPDVEVHGLVRWRSPLDNIRHILDRVTLHHGDLLDPMSLRQTLNAAAPGRIFHLGAQSYVDYSFRAPAVTMNTNITGTVNLLETVRSTYGLPRIHVCSSSEVYGQVGEDEVPITEDQPFRPASPYAVSKVGEDMVAAQYALSYGMHIVRSRMFTTTGPRRGDVFAESSFAKQIAEIEAGVRKGIKVGNLDSVRTICDVRDMVKAFWLLLEHGEPGEAYNIGGDYQMTVGGILIVLLRFGDVPIDVTVDPSRLRPSDVTLQIPDDNKFRKLTGWKPQIPVLQTLRDLLDWHRARVRRC